MADEVEANQPPIDFETVQKVFEINDTLDAMVVKVMELIIGATAALPTAPSKMAFLNKLESAITKAKEEARKELFK